ncbi:MAG: UbiA family prenyltransferase [Gemmatimonadota bacterium]|nr:UbiA family prenyltransferase [Gemmatimonadota bacterium]
MSSVRAILALVRWPNALMAAGAVAVGAWWVGGGEGVGAGLTAHVAFAALAALSLTAAANAWNDVADIAIDVRAHPERPLPSRRLSVAAARRVALVAAVTAVPLAALARPALGLLTLPVLALMRAYSPYLKRWGLPGNFTVAVLASLPVLYGAWAVGRPRGGLLLVAVATPLHFAREIAKDLDDADADAAERRTLPLQAGRRAARTTLLAATLLFVMLLVPLAVRVPLFALAALPTIFVCGLAVRRALLGRPGSPEFFKMAMLCAMAAFTAERAARG